MSDINTLADVIRVHGVGLPDEIALVQAGRESVTWAQLLDRSARIAQALADAGVGAGDRVAFLDKNGIEHFEVFFGAAMLNAVCVDVNWRLAAPEVAVHRRTTPRPRCSSSAPTSCRCSMRSPTS